MEEMPWLNLLKSNILNDIIYMIEDQVINQEKSIKTLSIIQTEVNSINRIALSVDCVIFGFDENKLKVLLIRSDLKKYQGKLSLLGDLVNPKEELVKALKKIEEFNIKFFN